MIQRIQTVYLLIALALLILFCFFPVAILTDGNGIVLYVKIIGFNVENNPIPLSGIPLFISALAALLNIITILLYKNRKRQLRLCIINIVLLVCLEMLLFYQVIYLKNTGMSVSYRIIFIVPLLCAILTYLAVGRIKKDEDLVRSYERLR